jgi:hypothetical protein
MIVGSTVLFGSVVVFRELEGSSIRTWFGLGLLLVWFE